MEIINKQGRDHPSNSPPGRRSVNIKMSHEEILCDNKNLFSLKEFYIKKYTKTQKILKIFG